MVNQFILVGEIIDIETRLDNSKEVLIRNIDSKGDEHTLPVIFPDGQGEEFFKFIEVGSVVGVTAHLTIPTGTVRIIADNQTVIKHSGVN